MSELTILKSSFSDAEDVEEEEAEAEEKPKKAAPCKKLGSNAESEPRAEAKAQPKAKDRKSVV